jgi:nucleoside-diphosphate kinase
METTLAIIKPDAVEAKNSGQIINIIELNDFNIKDMKKIQLTKQDAEKFYEVHKERPFFQELVDYMVSGPVIVLALEKEDAVKAWRDTMGETDPLKARPGSIRAMFGTSIGSNATHGSDSVENAHNEVAFFFPES